MERLIQQFRHKISYYSVVVRPRQFFLIASFGTYFLSFLVGILYKSRVVFASSDKSIAILIVSSIFLLATVFFLVANFKIKSHMLSIFPNIKYYWFSFFKNRSLLDQLHKSQKEKIKIFLLSEYQSPLDFEHIKASLQKIRNRKKVTFPVITILFGTIFVSLTNAFFSYIFKWEILKTFDVGFSIYMFFVAVIIALIGYFIALSTVFGTFLEIGINRDCAAIDQIIEICEDIYTDEKLSVREISRGNPEVGSDLTSRST